MALKPSLETLIAQKEAQILLATSKKKGNLYIAARKLELSSLERQLRKRDAKDK